VENLSILEKKKAGHFKHQKTRIRMLQQWNTSELRNKREKDEADKKERKGGAWSVTP